jgi:hypothetical protein
MVVSYNSRSLVLFRVVRDIVVTKRYILFCKIINEFWKRSNWIHKQQQYSHKGKTKQYLGQHETKPENENYSLPPSWTIRTSPTFSTKWYTCKLTSEIIQLYKYTQIKVKEPHRWVLFRVVRDIVLFYPCGCIVVVCVSSSTFFRTRWLFYKIKYTFWLHCRSEFEISNISSGFGRREDELLM